MPHASRYDPETRTVHLAPDASPYLLAHENAHRCQHRHGTAAWRASIACIRIPLVCRLARLWCEAEAARMALAALRPLITPAEHRAARREARAGIRSYVLACCYWRGIVAAAVAVAGYRIRQHIGNQPAP